MKFTKSNLEKIINHLSKAIGRDEKNMTIIGHGDFVQFEKTDNSAFASANLQLKSIPFKMVVDSSRILNIVKTSVNDEIEFKIKEDHLLLLIDKSKIKINQVEKEYPLFNDHVSSFEDGNSKTFVKGSEIKSALKLALNYVAPATEIRQYLTGVLFTQSDGIFTLVATNGVMMTAIQIPSIKCDNWSDVIVPSGVIKALISILADDDEVEICWDPKLKNIRFKTGIFDFVTPSIELRFPDWKKIYPDEQVVSPTFSVEKNNIYRAFNRMALLNPNHNTNLIYSNNLLFVKTLVEGLVSYDEIEFNATNAENSVELLIKSHIVLMAVEQITESSFELKIMADSNGSKILFVGTNFKSIVMGMKP